MITQRRLTEVLRDLELPATLQERLHVTCNECPIVPSVTAPSVTLPASFILYLPTVVLRHQHNPGFAVACHLANLYRLPVLVFPVVVDDMHHPMFPANGTDTKEQQPVVATARRLAFTLQALQKACGDWSAAGCRVLVRVHGPGARTPHHLTLARAAAVTVQDEPFVQPHLKFATTVERACAAAQRPCVRADGSTAVPPVCLLKPHANHPGQYLGVPAKAWMWHKKIKPKLSQHVQGAAVRGDLDAPPLIIRVDPTTHPAFSPDCPLYNLYPRDWNDPASPAPGRRAWTVQELQAIIPEEWALEWPGVDCTVRPCPQTHGATGWQRWKTFQQKSLRRYASKRNDIQQPACVSRLSCFLNLGTVSILQIVHELWQETAMDTAKFEDEIIKWREMSYAHAFASADHHFGVSALPLWAREYLERQQQSSVVLRGGYTLEQLATAQTDDATWNAMQTYLVETGELHNNARMTWGKSIVHWQKGSVDLTQLLRQMAYLNDRFALDGLSPPSYAGLLWCLGWSDKPASAAGSISTKPASRYRVGPQGFVLAQRRLLQQDTNKGQQASVLAFVQPRKKQRTQDKTTKKAPAASKPISSYFRRVNDSPVGASD